MDKFEIQRRITYKNGKTIPIDLFEWDVDTRTIILKKNSSLSYDFQYLSLNFEDQHHISINLYESCYLKAGDCWNIWVATREYVILELGSNCTVNNLNNLFSDTYNIIVKNKKLTNNNLIFLRGENEDLHPYFLDEYEKGDMHLFDLQRYFVYARRDIIKHNVKKRECKPIQIFDNSLMVVFHERQVSGDITIYLGKYLHQYFYDKDDSVNRVYIIKRFFNNKTYYSHGESLREAKEDLQYKIFKVRNLQSHLRRIKLQGYLTPEDYRILTGSCRKGIDNFLEENGLNWNSEKNIEEAIDLTKGHYGHDTLVKLLRNEKGNQEDNE